MKPGDEVELDIGAVAHGGHCVARHEGQVVFVRHAIPGERVRAVVTAGGPGSHYLRADAVAVLAASPDRVEPPCPYARPGLCGGCDWQHVSLEAQRGLKAAVVREQLQRLAGLDLDVVVEAVPGDEEGLGWRTRVEYAVDARGQTGFRRHRSHVVVPVDQCLIAHPEVDATQVTRRRWPGVESVEVASSSTGDRMVVVHPAAAAKHRRVPSVDAGSVLVGEPPAVRVLQGRRFVTEAAADRRWRVSGGFWQVHPGAAEVLVGSVLGALAPQAGERALDLYSGVGLFAGALAARLGPTGWVTAVEGSPTAVADARQNLQDMTNVRVRSGSVEHWLQLCKLEHVDLVILDPPRSGARRPVVEQIARLTPRAVAYVACDPAALARDVAYFAELGYVLSSLRAYDVFPMTQHVECVALLEPRGAKTA